MERTFEFHQGEYDLKWEAAGVCATLSAKWVQLIRDEKKTANDRKNALIHFVKNAPVFQKAYKVNFDPDNLYATCSFLVNIVGESTIQQRTIVSSAGLVNPQTLKEYIIAERKTGINFNFGFSKGAHCIAFWRSGEDTWHPSGHIYVFDPNFGEFKGDKSTFPAWFSDTLMRNYEDNVSDFTWSYYFRLVHKALGPVVKFGQKI